MEKLQTHLIANKSTRQLSALGFKQLNRIITKACMINGTHRYNKDSKLLVERVKNLVYSLIFEHEIKKEQLSDLQKYIKVINNKPELPAHFFKI